MDAVLGVGVELGGDFALVAAGQPEAPRALYAASVAGPDVVVRKFEADVVSAWGGAHYAWNGTEVYGSGTYRILRAKRGEGAVHGLILSKCFLSSDEDEQKRQTDGILALDGDLQAAFGRWVRRYTPLPFLPEWVDALYQAAKTAGLVKELVTLGRQTVRGALVDRKLPEWSKVLSDAVKAGAISVPEGDGANGSPLSGLDLDGYLQSWGPALASRAQKARRPLWEPGLGERGPEIAGLLQPLYEPQADVAEGLARTLEHRKGVILCGAMGTGKTRMGAAIAHRARVAHRTMEGRRGYRAIVQCPKHLLHKWVREVRKVIPGARAEIVYSGREMLTLLEGLRGVRPDGPEFYVISRDSAKLGWFYRPGAIWDQRRKIVVEREDPQTYRRVKALVPSPVWRCAQCGTILVDDDGRPRPSTWFDARRTDNETCPSCKEPLWQADNSRVRRCAIATAVRAKGRGVFDLLVADECHELKGGATAQGVALGTLAAAVNKVVLLTGTLFGGMALDVFYLLWRIAPQQMLADGQAYNEPSRWVQAYGRTEVEVTEEKDTERNRASRSGRKREPRMRPGISPLLYGRHLLDTAAFVDMEDVAPWLPKYTEIPDPVDMNEPLKQGYKYLANTLERAAREAAQRGDLSVYAAWTQTGLGWPDKAEDWPKVTGRGGVLLCEPPVVPPEADGLYPKERRLLEILEHERARGRKCAIYQTFTGTHDMLPRLEEITRARGFHPMVLRADKVDPEDREEWIAARLRAGGDLLICHPKVVETGLDLYDFPTIVWLQTGTSLFPVRQASRRSYRIGQTRDVEVRFLAYSDTLQTAQLLLMAKKLKAAAAAEGSITAEGLRVLAGDDDGSIALAQMLMKGMDGLKTAEAMWRQAAKLGTPPVRSGEEPKIQTMVGFLPVVAVVPKARKGQRARDGVAALAIDFAALGA